MTGLNRRSLLVASAASTVGNIRKAAAQNRRTLRIGVLTSLSGPYMSVAGPGSVLAARMAAEDFVRDAKPPFEVEILAGDIGDKVDVGANVARSWLDRDGVDVITDVANSALTLGLVPLMRERDKVGLFSSSPLTVLTGAQCSPNHLQWAFDTYAVAKTTGAALVKGGGDSWFFITADYTFGHSLADDTARFVREAGGRVLGKAAFPFPDTTDFSSYLLQAQASGAKVIGLSAGGTHMVNLIKQAAEFGIAARGQQLASLLLVINDVKALGLDVAQGLVFSDAFYWNLNDRTREWSRRFASRMNGSMPTMQQAANYSSVLHYLKASAAIGPERAQASGRAAIAQMKAMPTDDPVFGHGSIREDGRVIHDFYLYRVKAPARSHEAWDFYDVIETVPSNQAFRPMSEGGCPLVHT